MSHEGINVWAMGFGGPGFFFWIVPVLTVAALAKYVFKPGGRKHCPRMWQEESI